MHIHIRDLWQALVMASSSGRIPVCMSSMSVGVVWSALLIARVAIHCILVSWHVTLTNPVCCFAPGFFVGGLYHILALYVILGMATDM